MTTTTQSKTSCQLGCWGMALVAAGIAVALLMVLGDWRLIQALFAAVVIFIILGAVMSWMFCKPAGSSRHATQNPAPTSEQSARKAAAAAKEGVSPAPATSAAAAAETARKGTAPDDGAAPAERTTQADAPATPAATGTSARTAVQPSRELPGQADLAARKGEWRYDAGGASAAPAEPAPEDAPERLDTPRGDGPDDLKQIRGVGPKLEELLHSMGFYHFDQIAAWTDREVAWVDQNLEGFKGRVTRDNWVEQARTLASGGSTEFSDRVKKGDVYD
jgi:predicted flap endonuclease-1-like 5' DNA nuclease